MSAQDSEPTGPGISLSGSPWSSTSKSGEGVQEESSVAGLSVGQLERILQATRDVFVGEGLDALTLDRVESLAQLDPSADLYARARALQLAGQTPASLPPLEQLHASGEPIAESLFLHGWALHQGQRFDEAIPLYEAQLERDDAHVQTRKNLAHGLLQRGDAADALPHYLLLLERRPADNDLHHWLAECYSALGDEERAAHHAALYAGG